MKNNIKLKDMIPLRRYVVVQGNEELTPGDHVHYAKDGCLCCVEAQGWLNAGYTCDLATVRLDLAYYRSTVEKCREAAEIALEIIKGG